MTGTEPEAMTGAAAPSPHRAAREVRVWCVVPWYARPDEVGALWRDLCGVELDGCGGNDDPIRISLHAIFVNNASTERLELAPADGRGPTFEHVILAENRGGSGGFNAGMERALELSGGGNEGAYVWLLDSDARVSTGSVVALVEEMERQSRWGVLGSAIADPETGRVFEVGGRINRRTGALEPAFAGAAGLSEAVRCDYVASCSALVRMECIRRVGGLPELFLHGDDAAWCVRVSKGTGMHIGAVPTSIVYHPRFDRFALRGRYYAARNGFAPLRELGLGRVVALRRGAREIGRAVAQEFMGRSDLARLHVHGLRDAAATEAEVVSGRGSGFASEVEGFRPLSELAGALKPLLGGTGSWRVKVASERELGLGDAEYAQLVSQLGAAGLHVTDEARGAWRVVSARTCGAGLLRAPGLVEVAAGVRGGGNEAGFVVRTGDASSTALRAGATGVRAAWQAWRVACAWKAAPVAAPTSPLLGVRPSDSSGVSAVAATSQALSLSVVIVSYNRLTALQNTVRRVRTMHPLAEIIVADNASADGSAEAIEREFAGQGVTVLKLPQNLGVAAFNRGAAAATGDVLLILDDDAWPDVGVLEQALAVLREKPRVGAVSLHPRHPANGRSEWRHALLAEQGRDDWPILGCGNVVRRAAWAEVGGYEEGFFLYRNDVDLALKLLAAGWGVHFNPAWTVWHDSTGAARKGVRWHRIATRNWIWLAKRHGRGLGWGGVLGAAAGWAWAHRLAGIRLGSQWATLRGGVEGVFKRSPRGARGSGRPAMFERLVRVSMGRDFRR